MADKKAHIGNTPVQINGDDEQIVEVRKGISISDRTGNEVSVSGDGQLWTRARELARQAGGSIVIAVGNAADGNTVTLDDGVNTPTVLEFDAGVAASGSIAIAAGNVSDGDIVTLHDTTFEFDTAADPGEVTEGNIRVVAGAGAEASVDNLLAALLANVAGLSPTLTVKAAGEAGAFSVNLVWALVGVGGNFAVAVTGANLSKVDMTGGLNVGSDVGAGNVGVELGLTNLQSAHNLAAAITAAADLDISATDGGDGSISLLNDVAGAAGNAALARVGANITVVGMADGLDEVSLRTLQTAISALTVQITALVAVLQPS